ncbi:MAG: damage-inducible protein CinA [Hydrogenophilales bacterium CG03_land_8_20_14_0_80_62_28]|nr:CinA family protein [Betaproteobacteria bacterium]OIO78663.1 MAG: damage-inducible protein CinA [Hydrogenophilaceae bacterium CG1_02_62_390]PIV22432.1 MAG: damage-inducible protein CinA [Hydrogenophilales bacterium CG03_land_8_20_14_0_80_62_28]PIW38090.1 MAG: damage-inducible protein CinA [Hydrogenophilales bacterium CG15_BIG_FIL_POST_REV_8_21_14_020_62_31]PIW72835.1 MAG: damage-inducible protein CinA [Hydrogenophilales bacterium CG12_big_fil_rev_8_21_14_0_65_61_21]PIX01141.1 MAG: damage-in
MALNQAAMERLAAELGVALLQRGWRLAAAESCTGGWAAQAITAIPGSSAWFDCGFVTYSNEAKVDMLGVDLETLARFGAVSEATVREMAEGALRKSRAQASFAISGIAGPTGGSDSKPVGTVCFAWAVSCQATESATQRFDGNRRLVRMQAVEYAFRQLLARLPAVP